MQNEFYIEFISESISRINENTPRIKKCLDELSEDEVWFKSNPASNSIANLILHLRGNITQYIISGLGGEDDRRERDLEFTTSGNLQKSELISLLDSTIERAANIIKNINEKTLLTKKSVQGFNLSGIGIIIHVVEHYSYHTGQIAYITKLMKNKQLGFYANIDLNMKNQV